MTVRAGQVPGPSAPAPAVAVTIDGIEVRVPAGTNLVDAARQAGVEIPVFCHHPCLEPVGMCRMCLVEIGLPVIDKASGQPMLDYRGTPIVRFQPKLVAGCTTPVAPGMAVRCATPRVAAQRRAVLEYFLTSHPLDCPVCDKGGECPLQNLTMRYGPVTSRFAWSDKARFAKPVPIGPLIVLDRERCIQCARCIRFQAEVVGDDVLAFESRGRDVEVVSVSDPPFRSVFSGCTTDICPVGALTTRDFRFLARPWEVAGRPSVCPHCSVGCNITVDARHGRVMRVMPRRNDAVNDIWICDKGRFGHHYAASADRLRVPLVRRDGALVEATWDEALATVAAGLQEVRSAHGAASVGGIAGDVLTNEDLYVFQWLLRTVIGTDNVDCLPGLSMSPDLLPIGAGAPSPDWGGLGTGSLILVVGLDPENEAPVLGLKLRQATRRGARLAVVAGRPLNIDRAADVALRYRYGAEGDLLAALVRAVSAGSEDDVPPTTAGGVKPVSGGRTPAGHDPAVERAARLVAECQDLVVLCGLEAQRAGLGPQLAALVAAAGHADRMPGCLVPVGQHANARGAANMGLGPSDSGHGAADMLAGAVRAVLVVGCDPAGDGLVRGEALDGLDLLVVQELFLTATARHAHVVLPALSPMEREGTFTNLFGQCQRFLPSAAPVGSARADWRILGDLANRLGTAFPHEGPADVFADMAEAVPEYAGLSYTPLPGPAEAPTDVRTGFSRGTRARSVEFWGTADQSNFGAGLARSDPAPTEERAPEAGGAWAGRSSVRTGPSQAPASAAAGAEANDLLLVPVPRLFDGGACIVPSEVLHPLVCRPHVRMAPEDAERLGLADGQEVALDAPCASVIVRVRVQAGLTPGALLAPAGAPWPTPVSVLTGGSPMVRVTARQPRS